MISRLSSHRGSSDRFRKGRKNILPTPTPTTTPTVTETPTLTSTPTPTIIATETPTPTPTSTPTITNTSTPTPTPTVTNTPIASDPTLEIWYDFSDNNTITFGTGTDIVEVNDKSTGTVKPANSTGGKRPKQQTSYQNGLSVSYFDGDNDVFTINPITNFQSLTGATMIVVGKFNVTGTTQTMTQLGTTGVQRNANWLGTTGGKYRVGMGQGLATTTTDVDTNFHIFTSVFDGTQTGNSNRLKFRIDSIERPLTFTQNVSGTTSSDTSVFYIGETANAIEDLNGYIGEILLYTKTLNSTEIQNTEQYLKDKWNIVTPATTFSQTFTQSIAPTTTIETAWNTFRASLTGTSYTTFSFYSNLNTGITVTDAVKVQTLANSLRTGTVTNQTIGLNTWYVGTGCGAPKIGGVAVEFSNVASCSGSSTYALRPMINNLNWGGVNGSTVGAATQTITLSFS